RVAWIRLPPIVPIERSCGDAASAQASRSAAGTSGATSTSANVVPAPIRVPSTPRGMTSRRSTSFSAETRRSRSSGTRSGPADALDDPAFDLALRAQRVDHATHVVDRRDPLDAHLAGLDVDRDVRNLDPERQDTHPGRVRPACALAEDLRVLEQPGHLLQRPR